VLLTTSPGKAGMGCVWVRMSGDFKDEAEMKKHATASISSSMRLSAEHDINAYLSLLSWMNSVPGGSAGIYRCLYPLLALSGAARFAGSAIGGIRRRRRCGFRGEHNIVSDIEMIGIEQVNQAYERF